MFTPGTTPSPRPGISRCFCLWPWCYTAVQQSWQAVETSRICIKVTHRNTVCPDRKEGLVATWAANISLHILLVLKLQARKTASTEQIETSIYLNAKGSEIQICCQQPLQFADIIESAIPNYGQKSVYSTISLLLTLERKQLTQPMPVRNV